MNTATLWFALAVAFCMVYRPESAAADGPSPAPPSEREQSGLRGPVKTCVEEGTYPETVLAEGNTLPERIMHSETEYDLAGHRVAQFYRNPDGSVWATRYTYDPSAHLHKVATGKEGDPPSVTVYSYDEQGRLTRIDDGQKPAITFTYDHGRKTKTQVSRAEDYRGNVGVAADSPFDAADRAPNFPGGGTAITSYDEHDRPVEVRIEDAHGELTSRTVRVHDEEGRVSEEKQIVEDPLAMFPPEVRSKILQSSGPAPAEFRAQMAALMGGHEGFSSVTRTYDEHGRVKQRVRQIFNQESRIQTFYNEQGDVASEQTRTVRAGGTPGQVMPQEDSDVRYTYQYDAHGNWTEKITSVDSGHDGGFAPASKARRTLTYF